MRNRSFERLYEKKYMGYKTACWMWLGHITKQGYGSIRRNHQQHQAHRHFYIAYGGKIPAGLEIDHLCRNRACVNPDHMEPVTRAENIRRGDHAKLTVEDAKLIRELYALGNCKQIDLATQFGVGQTTISQVVTGKYWKDN